METQKHSSFELVSYKEIRPRNTPFLNTSITVSNCQLQQQQVIPL